MTSPERRSRAASARRPHRAPVRRAGGPVPAPARERFLSTDRYRARREWQRYEGTSQRALFLELRERFLLRHSPPVARVLDAGSGPGRFTAKLGGSAASQRVALDIGREMLVELGEHWVRGPSAPPLPDRVRGDAARPPFPEGTFGVVSALGNLLGFAEDKSDQLLGSLVSLLAPGGTLLLEVAPGPGERSRYLHRLPARSVARLLRAPPQAVAARVQREGFAEEPSRRSSAGVFQRVDPAELAERLEHRGFRVEEVTAVAPALGPDAPRIDAVARDPKAWGHLLEVEEELGRGHTRWPEAAAVLVAAVGPGNPRRGSVPPRPKSEG